MTRDPSTPPRLWSALVERLLDPLEAEVILGDLEEEYRESVLPRRGRRAADRWFRRMAVASVLRRRGRGRPLRLRPHAPSAPNPGFAMESLLQDVRFALRSLRRRWTFTAVVVTTLALAVGANTTIFALVDGVLLEPLPYPEPDELVTLWQATDERPDARGAVSVPNFQDWRARSGTVATMAGVRSTSLTLTGVGEPDVVTAALVSDRFLEVFGVAAARGRGIAADEASPGGPDAVLLSHAFWEGRLGSDPDVVGSSLQLDGTPHTVVGVAPEGFAYPAAAELWIGEVIDPATCGRGCVNFHVVGRLAPAVDLPAARSEFDAIAASMAREHAMEGFRVNVVPLGNLVTGDVGGPLLMLLGAVALVLLIACANVANLLLAKAWDRADEMAVRAALGAGRARIVEQLLTESAILAGVGGLLGLGLAAGALEVVAALPGLDLPRVEAVGLDGSVLLFTLAVVAAAVLLFGLAPAVGLARRSLAGRTRGSTGRSAGRPALVATQVALSAVLFLGTALLLRTVVEVRAVDLGFDTDGDVRILGLSIPPGEAPEVEEAIGIHRRFREGLESLPGVESVGAAFGAPLSAINVFSSVDLEGWGGADDPPNAGVRTVVPGYFGTLGVPLLSGRPVAASDRLGAEPVAWINETAARRWFGGESPLGRRIDVSASAGLPEEEPRRIVGVVADTRFHGPRREAPLEVYVPHAQNGVRYLEYFVEVRPGATPLLPAARGVLDRLDPRLPIRDRGTLAARLAAVEADTRLWTVLLGLFALIALSLAALGIFGVVAYQVSRRRREIGLRMAVGAAASRIVGLLVRQGLAPALVGLGAGLVLALAVAESLERMLFGVAPLDPLAWLGVSAVLVTVVVAASLLPALRATRIRPAEALRAE